MMGAPDEQVDRAVVIVMDLILLALYGGGIYGAVRYVRKGVIAGLAAHCLNLLSAGYSGIWTLANGDKIKEAISEQINENAGYQVDDEVAKAIPDAAMGGMVGGFLIG